MLEQLQKDTSKDIQKMASPSLTFKQYRTTDLIIFAFLSVVFEAIVTLGAMQWFPNELYSITIVYTMFVLVLMRWGRHAGWIALLCGATYCIVMKAPFPMFAVVCGGNLFGLFALFMHKWIGKQKIRDSVGWTVLYVAVCFACITVGRLLISLCFGLFDEVVIYTLYDLLSVIFAIVVVLLCRKQNGLFEDQKHYLLRMEEERKAKQAQGGNQ